ncbi:hypothetical protein CRG98_014862, partial [Punica granatum]
MSTSNHHPLLHTPSHKPSHHKTLCLILCAAAIILGSSALLAVHFIKTGPPSIPSPLRNVCHKAVDQGSCLALISEVVPYGAALFENDPRSLLEVFVKKSLLQTQKAVEEARDAGRKINDPREQAALGDCVVLLEMSMDRMRDAITSLTKSDAESQADAHTWLSSLLTNYVTCSDGLQDSSVAMKPILEDLISRAKASLVMFATTLPPKPSETLIEHLAGQFPSWVTSGDRRLLSASSVEAAVKANVVVAKDGSGNYKTVKEAIASAPDKGTNRYVIYIKKGTYKEKVEVGKKKTNVMLVGDGMDQTIITGSLNVVDGATTFNSATVAVGGDGFIAQDIWFQNTAGPEKHQAVALR